MNDPRWTWWDNLEGGPGEDELVEPRQIPAYAPSMTAAEIKAVLEARRGSSQPAPVADSWARRLGRASRSGAFRAVLIAIVAMVILAAGVRLEH